jgi:hypothetical protein
MWKLYVCAISYIEISKFNIRNSFYRLLSLVSFYWCLAYKRRTFISQHAWVLFTAVSFFCLGYILMELFTVLLRESSHISWEKIQVGCTPRHVVKKAGSPRVLSSFMIFHFPKSSACVFKRISGSFAGIIQFIFEVGFLKKLFYLRTDDIVKDVVALSLSQSILQCSTSSSYKITLSRPFVEVSTADIAIQVAEPRLWRGPIPN